MRKFITPVGKEFHRTDYESIGLNYGEFKEVSNDDLQQNVKLINLLKFGVVRLIEVVGEGSISEPKKKRGRKNN